NASCSTISISTDATANRMATPDPPALSGMTQAVAAPPAGWPEDDEASNAQLDLLQEIGEAMQATPASGPAGLALKILVMERSESEFGFCDRDDDGALRVTVVDNSRVIDRAGSRVAL